MASMMAGRTRPWTHETEGYAGYKRPSPGFGAPNKNPTDGKRTKAIMEYLRVENVPLTNDKRADFTIRSSSTIPSDSSGIPACVVGMIQDNIMYHFPFAGEYSPFAYLSDVHRFGLTPAQLADPDMMILNTGSVGHPAGVMTKGRLQKTTRITQIQFGEWHVTCPHDMDWPGPSSVETNGHIWHTHLTNVRAAETCDWHSTYFPVVMPDSLPCAKQEPTGRQRVPVLLPLTSFEHNMRENGIYEVLKNMGFAHEEPDADTSIHRSRFLGMGTFTPGAGAWIETKRIISYDEMVAIVTGGAGMAGMADFNAIVGRLRDRARTACTREGERVVELTRFEIIVACCCMEDLLRRVIARLLADRHPINFSRVGRMLHCLKAARLPIITPIGKACGFLSESRADTRGFNIPCISPLPAGRVPDELVAKGDHEAFVRMPLHQSKARQNAGHKMPGFGGQPSSKLKTTVSDTVVLQVHNPSRYGGMLPVMFDGYIGLVELCADDDFARYLRSSAWTDWLLEQKLSPYRFVGDTFVANNDLVDALAPPPIRGMQIWKAYLLLHTLIAQSISVKGTVMNSTHGEVGNLTNTSGHNNIMMAQADGLKAFSRLRVRAPKNLVELQQAATEARMIYPAWDCADNVVFVLDNSIPTCFFEGRLTNDTDTRRVEMHADDVDALMMDDNIQRIEMNDYANPHKLESLASCLITNMESNPAVIGGANFVVTGKRQKHKTPFAPRARTQQQQPEKFTCSLYHAAN